MSGRSTKSHAISHEYENLVSLWLFLQCTKSITENVLQEFKSFSFLSRVGNRAEVSVVEVGGIRWAGMCVVCVCV